MNRWIAIVVALAIGLFMLSVDRRTDDTGIEAMTLLAAAAALTAIAPRGGLAIALAIGLPIAVLNGGAPAILFSAIGALAGYAAATLGRRAAPTA